MSEELSNKTAMAEVNRWSGRAIIHDPNGEVYVLDISESLEVQSSTGVSLGTFLEPSGMEDIERRDAGKYPYKDLVVYVNLAYFQESCLMMVLSSLNPDETEEARRLSAAMALDLMEQSNVRDWLVKRLTDTPLPKEADIDGLPDERLQTFLRELPQSIPTAKQ